MTHEPRLYKEKMDYRESWFQDELIRFLPRIENLASKSALLGTGEQISYRLDYQQRRRNQGPAATEFGSFNIVFFLTATSPADNMLKHIVLRIPYPDRQYAREAYEQEAATLSYLTQKTTIPAPLLLHHGFDKVMNVPYMVMTQIEGRRLSSLGRKWDVFPVKLRRHFLRQIGAILNQLLQIKFESAGSLMRHEHKQSGRLIYSYRVERRPSSFAMESAMTYGRCNLDDVVQPKQTFNSAEDYYQACMQLHWKVFTDQSHLVHKCYDILGANAVIREYNMRKAMENALPSFQQRHKVASSMFRLQHPDFRAGNIFVDPETFEITGIIDWDRSSVVPLPLYRLPTFKPVYDYDDFSPELFENYQTAWRFMLEEVEPFEGFDFETYFNERTRHDYYFARALEEVDALVAITCKAGLFPPEAHFAHRNHTTDDKTRVTSKLEDVSAYDRHLRSSYSLEELQKLYRSDANDLFLTQLMARPSGRYRRRRGTKSMDWHCLTGQY